MPSGSPFEAWGRCRAASARAREAAAGHSIVLARNRSVNTPPHASAVPASYRERGTAGLLGKSPVAPVRQRRPPMSGPTPADARTARPGDVLHRHMPAPDTGQPPHPGGRARRGRPDPRTDMAALGISWCDPREHEGDRRSWAAAGITWRAVTINYVVQGVALSLVLPGSAAGKLTRRKSIVTSMRGVGVAGSWLPRPACSSGRPCRLWRWPPPRGCSCTAAAPWSSASGRTTAGA